MTAPLEADKELDELIWLLVPEERRGYAKEALKKFVDKAVVAELVALKQAWHKDRQTMDYSPATYDFIIDKRLSQLGAKDD